MSKLMKNLDLHQEQELKPNIILDDYLDLIRCSYPHCNCGKCITKKLSHNTPNYKYKNINSSYKKEYLWKEQEKKEENEDVNRNIKLHEKNNLKNNHLKDSLQSTMKRDFIKNQNTKIEENKSSVNKNEKAISEYKSNLMNSMKGNNINEINYKDHRPFIGRSNYDSNFPNWQFSKNQMNQEEIKPKESIPFNGNSNYKEKFINYEQNHYVNKRSLILNSPSLSNSNKIMDNESTFKDKFKPIDYQSYKEVNDTPKRREGNIVSGPYCKNSFLSSYEKAFMYNNLSVKKERGSISNILY